MLKVGFSRVDITPMLGIPISGYFKPRTAEGVLDTLQATAVAFENDGKKAVMIALDLLEIEQTLAKIYREKVAEAVNIPLEAVFISSLHTHTGPETSLDTGNALVDEYIEFLGKRIADVSVLAFKDLKNAKMGYGVGTAPNVAFVRRFRMKDGSIKTNPGVDNPDIVAPVGDVDERVNVVRFDREGAETVVLVNFANHPDVVGGNLISGDWTALVRGSVEKILDNTKCAFFNGAQGDVNHVNVHPTGGYLNDMFMDFDDVARGYEHAKYIARVVTGGVLQAFDKVKYTDNDKLDYINRIIKVPSNMPDKKDLPEAYRIKELYDAGRDTELPYTGMMLTTVVAEALRMVKLENGPESFDMTLSAVAIGPVVFVGVPGEPFTSIGRGIKEYSGYELVSVTCLTNGSQGYFPARDAYTEGGYEARSSRFKSGVAEFIVDESKKMLDDLKG